MSFAMVDTDAIRWMLRNVQHAESPPDAVCLMELAGALVIGELPSMTQREWSQRWKCGRGKVRRIASKVADHYRTTNEHYRTTITECFPHLTRVNEPALNTTGPIRARSFKEEEKEKEATARQPKAAGSIPFPGQDKPAPPEKTEAEKGLDILREIRTEHHQAATGSKPRGVYCSSGKAKAAMLVRVKRYLGEVKGAQYGEPLEVLRTYAEWVYLGPDPFWRNTSDPLGQALGGKANDPTNRLARTVAALDWQDSGGGTLPRVREMVAGLEGLVKKHAYLVHAVEGEPEEVAEQFKGLLETATGIDRTEVWARMRAANAWQFGKWTEAARAAM